MLIMGFPFPPDDYIATLESSGSSEGSVQVYLNWRADLSQNPMRARVGRWTWTSMRQCEREGDKRMEVVAIPLKHRARCIGIDGSTGNLAIGVGSGVLVYALCCKIAGGDNGSLCGYEDMKCLLELTFSFKVRKVALSEEYIAVASDVQVQVVRLNMKSIPPPTKDGIETKRENCCCPCMQKNLSSSSLEGETKVEVHDEESQYWQGFPRRQRSLLTRGGDSGLESSASYSEDSTGLPAPRPPRPTFSRQSSNSQTASPLDYDQLTSSSSMEDLNGGSQSGAVSRCREQSVTLKAYPAVVEEVEPSNVTEDEISCCASCQ